jgi:hypothetical protein
MNPFACLRPGPIVAQGPSGDHELDVSDRANQREAACSEPSSDCTTPAPQTTIGSSIAYAAPLTALIALRSSSGSNLR